MDNPSDPIKLYATPTLRRPYLVAAWSGMGAVALLATNYLRQELSTRFFAEIEPHDFFSPSQVRISDGLIQGPEFPESKFYFWDRGDTHDLIFFVGTEQPSNAYEMANHILDICRRFGVERIYTAAAFPTFIHHSQEPRVWGTATHPHLLVDIQAYDVKIIDQGTIDGLNGLLLSVAREHDIEGLCLLGEIPVYAIRMINPKASRAVLAVMSEMLDVEIDLMKLTLWAEDLQPEMDKLYDILPDHVKQAIESSDETVSALHSAFQTAEQPLVADDAFFDEIAQFLEQHGQSENDQEENDSE